MNSSQTTHSKLYPAILTAIFYLGLIVLAGASRGAETVTVPVVEHLDCLDSWSKGVAAADARQKLLQVVCIGDSNTEGPAYVSALRSILQGCYGERGIGYFSLGNRAEMPEYLKITRKGQWEMLRDAPKGPPPPRFALDGIWCQSADTQAEVVVEFVFGGWDKSADPLARAYNLRQNVRIHYQVGPEQGSFTIFLGNSVLRRVDCKAAQAGYAVSEAFLADGFRIADVQGKVVLFGFDAVRMSYQHGSPLLAGGALVHALGKSWGRTEEPATVEDDTYAKFFGAIHPDLITILLGTNDQHNDGRPHSYRDWLTTIIHKLQKNSPGTGILVIACPEANYTKSGLAAQFRDTAREVAVANHCAFWSLQDLIGSRSANWYRQGFFNDSLHYNPIGGGLWVRLLLRQLGFDINDLKHYPVLLPAAAATAGRTQLTVRRLGALTLDTLAGALAKETPHSIWIDNDRLAELRLAVAGDALAADILVHDRQCAGPQEAWTGGGVDLYVANPQRVGHIHFDLTGPIVRQVVFNACKPKSEAQVRVHEFTEDAKNVSKSWQTDGTFPYAITPLQPYGYEVRALIPLSLLALTGESREFLLECAAQSAPAPGGQCSFNRMFALTADQGAFRDASQAALVRIQ